MSHFLRKSQLISYDDFVAVYTKNQWVKIGRWPLPNLSKSVFGDAMSYSIHAAHFGIVLPNLTYLDVDGETYYTVEDVALLEKAMAQKLADIPFFEKYLLMQVSLRKTILKQMNSLPFVNSSSYYSAFCAMLDDLYKVVATFNFETAITPLLEKAIADRLEFLGRKDVYLPQLLNPDTASDTAKLHAALVKYGKNITLAQCEELAAAYGYINTYFLSSAPYSADDIRQMALKTETKLSAKQINIADKMLSEQVWLLNELAIHKLVRFEFVMKIFYLLEPHLASIAQKAGVESVKELYMDELLDCIASDYKKIGSKTRFQRSGFVCKNEFLVLSGNDAMRFKKEYLEKISVADSFSGTGSYPGHVKGTVRVIKSLNEFSQFKDGEILVCSMTDPNFLPLMKKASAIVTDMGGILCHAAIVSRELHKPCVIGTKIATSALKTGDRVEVDAVKGTVRKIYTLNKRTEELIESSGERIKK